MTLLSDPTPGLRKFVKRYINPGIGVRGRVTGAGRWVHSVIGTSSGVAQLNVLDAPTGNMPDANTSYRWITLSPIWVVNKPLRRFILTRMIPGTTLPQNSGQTIGGVALPNIGDINGTQGTFNSVMGLAPFTTSYQGVFFSTNLELAGTRQFYVGYLFIEDDNGITSNIPARYFTGPQPLLTNFTGTGFVNASTLGIASVIVPTASDFSAFVTPYP